MLLTRPAVLFVVLCALDSTTDAVAPSGRKPVTTNETSKELRDIVQQLMTKICYKMTKLRYCFYKLYPIKNFDKQFDKDIEYCLEETGYEEGVQCDAKAVQEQALRLCEIIAFADRERCKAEVIKEFKSRR